MKRGYKMKYVIVALMFTGCAIFQPKEIPKEEPIKKERNNEREDFVAVAYTKIEALIRDTSVDKSKKVLFTKATPGKITKQVSYEIKRMIRSRAVSISFKIEDNLYVAQVVTELFDAGSNSDVISVETVVIKLSDADEFLHKLKIALRRAI